jgi:D-glutamate cyclase-like, C-terminal
MGMNAGRRAALGDEGEGDDHHESLHERPPPCYRAKVLPDFVNDPVDLLLALDPGARGIDKLFQFGGARRAAEALRGAGRVVITTGFVVASETVETDGPPGAAVLGRALRELGADVGYVTDGVTAPVLSATLAALGEPKDVTCYPVGADAARATLERMRPTHLVAIERPGRARDGVYRNMRGDDVSAWNAPIDELFLLAGRTGVRSSGRPGARSSRRPGVRSPAHLEQATHGPSRAGGPRYNKTPFERTPDRVITIGVGDGGNEIGMGNVRARLTHGGALARRIASVVRVDHLVVAGVSNWGAYGIAAHLGRLAGRPLLHTPNDERRIVAACVAAGACDGVTRRREATVDGLPLDVHAALVALLAVATQPRT